MTLRDIHSYDYRAWDSMNKDGNLIVLELAVGGGQQSEFIRINWDGEYHQYYITNTGGNNVNLCNAIISYDGYIKNGNYDKQLLLPNTIGGYHQFTDRNQRLYFTQSGEPDLTYSLYKNGAFLRLNNLSMFAGDLNLGWMMTLNSEYCGNYDREQGGIITLYGADNVGFGKL